MEFYEDMKRESGMSDLDLTRNRDWKLNRNVHCRVTLEKMILPSEKESDLNLEENGVESRSGGSLCRNDNNIDADTDTHCYRNLKLLIHEALGIFQKCEKKCGVCDKYIQKLFNHLIDSHGEIPTDSGHLFPNKNLDLETQKFLSDPGLNTIPGYENEIHSEDVKPVISPINPPEHVNYFNIINNNLKQEPDDIECQEDPLLNLEHSNCAVDIMDNTNDTDMHGENESNRKFQCLLCPKSFMTNAHLSRHNLTHTGERPHKCETCGRRFTHNYHLTAHKRIHTEKNLSHLFPNEKKFACIKCGKDFVSKSYLSYHDKVVHAEKPCICIICGKRFIFKNKLKAHMATHLFIMPFKCDLCEKKFASLASLKYHKVLHTGEPREKPHNCEVCGKSFAVSRTLKEHKKIHMSDKPHKCQTCGMGFIKPIHLRSHLVTHTGVKAFKCELCDRSFGTNNTLRLHTKNIHTREKRKPI